MRTLEIIAIILGILPIPIALSRLPLRKEERAPFRLWNATCLVGGLLSGPIALIAAIVLEYLTAGSAMKAAIAHHPIRALFGSSLSVVLPMIVGMDLLVMLLFTGISIPFLMWWNVRADQIQAEKTSSGKPGKSGKARPASG